MSVFSNPICQQTHEHLTLDDWVEFLVEEIVDVIKNTQITRSRNFFYTNRFVGCNKPEELSSNHMPAYHLLYKFKRFSDNIN